MASDGSACLAGPAAKTTALELLQILAPPPGTNQPHSGPKPTEYCLLYCSSFVSPILQVPNLLRSNYTATPKAASTKSIPSCHGRTTTPTRP
jgi:hypothetical protein